MTQTADEARATHATTAPSTRWWPQVGLWVVGAIILFLYSGLWRPIWFDEFLHFAMGGMTLDYALKTVDYTTIEVNHGQTGVYMLLDYLLMQAFGASAIALRLPSLLAAAIMLAAAVSFLRLRRLGFAWQLLVLLAFAGHSFLMGFTGEARPYMPLAAATVATLTYYQYGLDERRALLPRLYGAFGIVVGSLMHPYIVYLIAMLLPFSVWMAVREQRIRWNLRDIVRFANPLLLGIGAALFLVVGQLTWMRRILSFGYEPLALLGSPQEALWAFVLDHLANRRTAFTWIAGLVVLTLACLAARRFAGARVLGPPLVLLAIGAVSSALVSALSVQRTYWILERQWVAGIALVVIAVVWLFGEMHAMARRQESRVLLVPVVAFAAVTVASAVLVLIHQAQGMITDRDTYQQLLAETRSMDELRPAQINDDDGFIYAANVNIVRGGPVWPMYVDWYGNLSGMRPEFRETNPSWTGFLGDQRTLNNG